MVDLAEFMDRYADRRPVRGESFPLSSAGGASRRIALAVGSRERAEQVLASLFWWCYVRTRQFERDTGDISQEGQRHVVVSHGRGSMHDLLILAPGVGETYRVRVRPVFPTRQIVARGLEFSDIALREGGRMQAMLTRAGIEVDVRSVVLAVNEVAAQGDFKMGVARLE